MSFQQLFTSYMYYIEKADETTFILKIRVHNVDEIDTLWYQKTRKWGCFAAKAARNSSTMPAVGVVDHVCVCVCVCVCELCMRVLCVCVCVFTLKTEDRESEEERGA
jgi:hypothetical protein